MFMYIPVFILGHPGFLEWSRTPLGLLLFALALLGMFFSVYLPTFLLLRYRLVVPVVVLLIFLVVHLRPVFHPRLQYLQFGAIVIPVTLLAGYLEYKARRRFGAVLPFSGNR